MLKFWNKLNLTSPGHFQIIDFFEMIQNKTKRNFTIFLLLIQNTTKLLVHYIKESELDGYFLTPDSELWKQVSDELWFKTLLDV